MNMNLPDEILNLPCVVTDGMNAGTDRTLTAIMDAYKMGHKDCRKAAAKLASKADVERDEYRALLEIIRAKIEPRLEDDADDLNIQQLGEIFMQCQDLLVKYPTP